MAERRMFSRVITGCARFLRLPATARLLYYDLGMDADDDGCVEAFVVMRKTGASEDDLRILAGRGFITVLNEDLVAHITDWDKNNAIRKDRYHAGIYRDLIPGDLLATNCTPDDNQMTTKCQPDVNHVDVTWSTEVRLGKDRLGKVSVEDGDDDVPSPPLEKPKRKPKKADVFETFAGESKDLLDALRDFDQMRTRVKKPMTERAKSLMLAELSRLSDDPAEQVAILNQSISKCWLGVFPLHDKPKPLARGIKASTGREEEPEPGSYDSMLAFREQLRSQIGGE